VHEDAKVFPRRLLADEFVEALRAKSLVRILGSSLGRRDTGGVGGAHRPKFTIFMECATIFVKLRAQRSMIAFDHSNPLPHI
jgi:hypothetical protein